MSTRARRADGRYILNFYQNYMFPAARHLGNSAVERSEFTFFADRERQKVCIGNLTMSGEEIRKFKIFFSERDFVSPKYMSRDCG